ncbi:hypothetical protein T10_3407 [Trichinella papuae]|uniref:Uncharacterized protein n=1 Tax=Trichinella papuae TaxID=268474 RepID=A0A0V1N2D1_9BILA|nr:hypothetical protein T10_3407 [Trichinella papuae]
MSRTSNIRLIIEPDYDQLSNILQSSCIRCHSSMSSSNLSLRRNLSLAVTARIEIWNYYLKNR